MKRKRNAVQGSTVFWILVIIAGGYVLVVTLMYLLQSAFIYFPSRNIIATPETLGIDYEDVSLFTEDDVRLHGWYIPAENARGTLLFFHGNAGNISGRLESISIFHNLKLNVMIFDYRGYGKSEGSPTEAGTYRDAEAAWKYLTEVQNESPSNVILFGRSLGCGVAAWMGAQVKAGGLVLESTFTSTVDLAGDLYPFIPVRWLMHIRYPVSDYMTDIDAPVMVAHSRGDEVIPYHHGEKVYEIADDPKLWLELRGGHNDGFLVTGQEYITAWEEFLEMASL